MDSKIVGNIIEISNELDNLDDRLYSLYLDILYLLNDDQKEEILSIMDHLRRTNIKLQLLV